jgi:two-component system nitrogen regulation response regulator GlnG
VGLLAKHFLERAAAEGLPRKRLNAAATARLLQHNWPGNVRELENMMRRLAALRREEVITAAIIDSQIGKRDVSGQGEDVEPLTNLSAILAHHLAKYFAGYGNALPSDGLYDRLLEEFERPLLIQTLVAVGNNQLRAAKLLGINRNTLRKKLTELGIAIGGAPTSE